MKFLETIVMEIKRKGDKGINNLRLKSICMRRGMTNSQFHETASKLVKEGKIEVRKKQGATVYTVHLIESAKVIDF